MKIGIEVNGVLRDTIEKFRQIYEKHMIEEITDESYTEPSVYELDESGNTEEISIKKNFKYEIFIWHYNRW